MSAPSLADRAGAGNARIPRERQREPLLPVETPAKVSTELPTDSPGHQQDGPPPADVRAAPMQNAGLGLPAACAEPGPTAAAAPDRVPRLRLPASFPLVVSQVYPYQPEEEQPWVRQEAAELATMTSALLTEARTVSDVATPLSAHCALFMTFQPALDSLAEYLTRCYGLHSKPVLGVIVPPSNYPMPLQTAIRQLAETVQAAQDWDARQSPGRAVDPLPAALVTTLEQVSANLQAAAQTLGQTPPVPDAPRSSLPAAPAPQPNAPPAHLPALDQYVTLDKMAALVSRSPRTLEKLKTRSVNPLPRPAVEGGGGKPHEWLWAEIRPWLEKEYGRKLPPRFPGDRFRDPRAERN